MNKILLKLKMNFKQIRATSAGDNKFTEFTCSTKNIDIFEILKIGIFYEMLTNIVSFEQQGPGVFQTAIYVLRPM